MCDTSNSRLQVLHSILKRAQPAVMTHFGSTGFSLRGMALWESRLHHGSMNTRRQPPRIGDRVRISGFLGSFEIVEIRQDGLMADLKHLDLPGPEYIEREILSKELIYLGSTSSSDNSSD